MYNALKVDRQKLTIMGVKFSNLKELESFANAIGSNMFEGFEPTQKNIEIIRDYISGKTSLSDIIKFAKNKSYV